MYSLADFAALSIGKAGIRSLAYTLAEELKYGVSLLVWYP